MTTTVAIIGAGSWGTTVASLTARRVDTVLWVRRPELADEIATTHENSSYLPGVALPQRLRTPSSLGDALADADVVVMGVPSHGFRAVARDAAELVKDGVPVVSLTKGVEQETLARMTEVLAETMPGHPAGMLTGPNLAREVAAGQPTASVVAMVDEALCREL